LLELLGSFEQVCVRRNQDARRRITRLEAPAAVLANDDPAEVLDSDLQGAPTSGALLKEIGACCHYGISFYRTA
jgi:hypothetical protein